MVTEVDHQPADRSHRRPCCRRRGASGRRGVHRGLDVHPAVPLPAVRARRGPGHPQPHQAPRRSQRRERRRPPGRHRTRGERLARRQCAVARVQSLAVRRVAGACEGCAPPGCASSGAARMPRRSRRSSRIGPSCQAVHYPGVRGAQGRGARGAVCSHAAAGAMLSIDLRGGGVRGRRVHQRTSTAFAWRRASAMSRPP